MKEQTHINEIEDLKRRVWFLFMQLQDLELKHQEDLKKIEEIKKKPASETSEKTMEVKPVSYEEIKKKKNAEMKDKMEVLILLIEIRNFG